MVNISKLVQDFRKAQEMKCPYVSPGNVSMSTIANGVDCSGLFVAAFSHQGAKIYHGSNTIARSYLSQRQKLTKVSQLRIGMAVFKWQSDGDYPAKYHADGLGNFHHIGLVVSVSPLQIIHASSAKHFVTMDTSIKAWSYCGFLSAVDYEQNTPSQTEQEEVTSSMYYRVKVTVASLRIREQPNTSSAILGNVTMGEELDCTEVQKNWYKLYGRDGWVCGTYVKVLSTSSEEPEVPVSEETTSIDLQEILARLDSYESRLKRVEDAIDVDHGY